CRAVPIETLAKTTAATATAAAVGAIATKPAGRWYRSLEKPPWQPPAAAFPAVWTPLYALIAFSGARALDRAEGDDRDRFRRTYAANLTLNTAWTMLFFRARRPVWALAEIVLLNAANLALFRRTRRIDRVAANALLPYLAWTGFATALNASIAARNQGRGRSRGNG
ncbi:MAG TPA: TspO/MBR family protein, partial [Micromonosporaceae bacterium]